MPDWSSYLPVDRDIAVLVGRVWRKGSPSGPSVVKVVGDLIVDISSTFPFMSALLEEVDPARSAKLVPNSDVIGTVEDILSASLSGSTTADFTHFLSPVDLQAIKACGVTYLGSLLERVIEERCDGNAANAHRIRTQIEKELGQELRSVRPNSSEAKDLKSQLLDRGLWSQYLEVGIGPDVEVFTKAQPLSTVGLGAQIGIHPRSEWSNSEPEVALVASSRGKVAGATLANDMNLRDFESRSALLLGMAKDNNASCAIGPFVRLFDANFSEEQLHKVAIHFRVSGADGFSVQEVGHVAEISREFGEIVKAVVSANHQYPDGLVILTGTMFAPVVDRDVANAGFTHKIGDRVSISCSELGTLENVVNHSNASPPWTFGFQELVRNLKDRSIL